MKNKKNKMLFLFMFLYLMFPFLYSMVRTYLINDIPSTDGLTIASQMEWFDLINETILAFLTIPLYSILNKNKDDLQKNITTSLFITSVMYIIFSLIVVLLTNVMVKNMEVDVNLLELTSTYLKLETLAFVFGFFASYSNVIFVILGETKYVVGLIIAKTISTIIGDLVLIPRFNVLGVAYSNILVNISISMFCLIILSSRKFIAVKNVNKNDFFVMGKNILKKGLFSGGQSFLDNWIYAIMVCKMINVVSSQGLYWTANNFIWGFLLVPVSTLAEIIKQESNNDEYSLKDTLTYSKTTGIIILCWLVSILLWPTILSKGMNVPDVDAVLNILYVMLPFYIVYSLTSIIDSQFCGLGKLKYSFINSLIVNVIYYGIWYILFVNNISTPTLNSICCMFGFGMVVHFVVNVGCVLYEIKHVKKI